MLPLHIPTCGSLQQGELREGFKLEIQHSPLIAGPKRAEFGIRALQIPSADVLKQEFSPEGSIRPFTNTT